MNGAPRGSLAAPAVALGAESAAGAARLAEASVVLLAGGRSSEREVSLVSSRAIAQALAPLAGDPRPRRLVAVEIDARGRWIVGRKALRPHVALQRLPEDALFFLGLHGGEGEDGRVQAFLELCGRAHTGSGHAASALCMDKERCRRLFASHGLAVAEGRLVTAAEGARALGELAAGGGPWFVKPNHGGSSVGAGLARSREELEAHVERLLAAGDDVLVERALAGLEVTVGLLGPAASPRALPVVEILPASGRFFDWEQKYAEDGALERCPPVELPPAAAERAAQVARAAWHAAGCEGYARVDLIVPREDDGAFGEPVVLEVNTLPGFTPRSLLPRAAAAAGIGFRALCLELCHLALERVQDAASAGAERGG